MIPRRLAHAHVPGPPAKPIAESGSELLDELLDPDSWTEILGRYGRTMNLAVALTDVDGNVLGPCHNPQPVWRLTHHEFSPACCAFCLAPNPPCNAVEDALATREVVYAHDPSGLTHVAIPLFLDDQPLGALIAGQVFSHYPQPLALQRVARDLKTSQQALWAAAVHQVPVSKATLRLYAALLASLGQAFVRQRYSAVLDRELHQTSLRYRLMIDGSKDRALITLDAGGCILSWNPGAERLLGYTEAEILGQNSSRFFTPETIRGGIPENEIRLAAQNGSSEKVVWHVRKDGTRFLSETVTARLGEGDAQEFGRLLHDVTEARKLAEAALQAQKLESIGILAGGIAHDFNNLLTGILGNVTLAMEGLAPDDPARPPLEIAERSSLEAGALTSQLLAYAGSGAVTLTRFDLSKLISDVLPLIATLIPKTVRLDLSLPRDLPWIRASASEVRQIVMNLVINGAEAIGPEGGIVGVQTGRAKLDAIAGPTQEDQSGAVYLEVRDSGCGMDEETKCKIFDPFFTTKFVGRGLGLAAVSGIVRRLKGQLDVESAPGKGSKFRIVFPAVLAEPRETKTPPKRDLRGTGVILVVDDDPLIRGLARAALERYGYSVLLAENGEAGVELFRKNSAIAAVLLDLTMPVMGGVAAFGLMNAIRPEIPVIISTGYGEMGVSERFNGDLGGVIAKPYTVTELAQKIADVLARKNEPDASAQ